MDSCDTEYAKPCGNPAPHARHIVIQFEYPWNVEMVCEGIPNYAIS